MSGNIAWLSEAYDDDPGRLRSDEDRHVPRYEFCDACGRDVGLRAVSLAGLGIFCSADCATKASLKHALAMARRSR